MKIASPSDEVSIERSENRAFDRALVGGASYFGLEVRTGCATLGLFLQPQIVYTLKLLCPNVKVTYLPNRNKYAYKLYNQIIQPSDTNSHSNIHRSVNINHLLASQGHSQTAEVSLFDGAKQAKSLLRSTSYTHLFTLLNQPA